MRLSSGGQLNKPHARNCKQMGMYFYCSSVLCTNPRN